MDKKIKRSFYNQKNIKEAIKMLKRVTDILDEHNIDYYLDFGTLLGAIREKGFIKWDHDMDISLVNEDDYKKIPLILKEIKAKHLYRTYLYTFKENMEKIRLKREKSHKPFKKINIDFTNENNYQIAKIRTNKFLIFGRGHICLDIFFKYKKENKLYWMAFASIYSTDYEPLKKGFTTTTLYGYQFKIPKAYKEYLQNIYGDWEKPKEHWNQSEHKALTVNNLGSNYE